MRVADFGTAITTPDQGNRLYEAITDRISAGGDVKLDFDGVLSMTTFCAKQVFGRLYVELGAESFYQRVKFQNASEDLKIVVQTGIESSLADY